ncbi:MAG: class I SAM-dependent methyltransferase [Candidatus Cloacimonetes bacterium]|nr:class I SAM-dependent methyltransferase [Candidatus Cloacimonadota bacterium]
MNTHNDFYKLAEIYDIAFDFRDIKAECDFLENVFQQVNGRKPKSVLELAAGPDRHMLEFSHRGLKEAAIDLSPEMVEYGKQLSLQTGIYLRYECANMEKFTLGEKYDLAVILMDSTAYLLDNEAVLNHLASVADHLTEDGLYILEMTHPRDCFGIGRSTVAEWTSERKGIQVHIKWGKENDFFDPIDQITQVNVEIEIVSEDKSKKLVYCAKQRCFTANEMQALVKASGSFQWIETYGSLDIKVPFNNDESAWRMVPVLKKFRN